MHRNAPAFTALLLTMPMAASAQQGDLGAYRVTGKVVMADGSPIPDPAGVEFVCGGQIRKRVKPYASGDFSIVLSDDSSDTQSLDIATPRNPATAGAVPFSATKEQALGGEDVGRFDFSGCELRAAMPGYQSNAIALGPRRRLDKSEVGQIMLRRTDGAVDAVMVSGNMVAAPPRARAAFDNARREAQKEKPDYTYAAAELKKALDAYPTFAAAWHLTGIMCLSQKDPVGANQAFRSAIAADATYVEPYIELASMELVQHRWAEAARWIDSALKLNPNIPYAHYLAASVHFQLGNLEPAERSALAVWNSRDIARFPLTHYILGGIKAQRGDFESAAARFRDYLATKPDEASAQSVRELLGDWEREGRITKLP